MDVDLDRPDTRFRILGAILFVVFGAAMVYEATIGPDWLFLPIMVGMGLSFVCFLYASILWKRRVLEDDL